MGPGDLGRILCGLELPTDKNLIVGSETCDDAGVYRLNDTTALIQTLDFFTPIVDDPHAFGRITAANALSDVYAMGGKPLLCMNILACPVKTMDNQVFRKVVEGGLAKIKEAGALLVGGHSIEDDELKYGLSVTGTVHPDHILLNSGARPGDLLVLTKPLGTGILSTALKGGLADLAVEQRIVEVMATLNRLPAEVVGREDFAANPDLAAHSCTDITGFGLLGHLHEMAEASGVAMRVKAGDLPVLAGALDFVDMGIIPEGAYTNQKYYRQWVAGTLNEADPRDILCFDPQTSGGLLYSLPPAGAERLLAELAGQTGPAGGWIIGEVLSGKKGSIQLVS
jgi:selenide,water dikinase